MGYEFDIPLICSIFLIFLCFIYFTKEKIKVAENKYFELILVSSLMMTILNVVIHSFTTFNTVEALNNEYHDLFRLLNVFLTSMFIIVLEALLGYIITISYKNVQKKIYYVGIAITLLYMLIAYNTNINIVKIGNITNVEGSMITTSFIFAAILMFITLIITLINRKKMDKRYTAVYFIIGFVAFAYIIIIFVPGILFYDIALALLCYVMYHTIENPDIKMINIIEQEKQKAEHANNAKTDFLSSMSHEIRTPLNAIVGFSEFIKSSENLEEAKENADDIISSSKTLLEIVNGILDISKIEAGKLELVNIDYDIYNLINEVEKIAEVRKGDKNIALTFDIAEDLPHILYGDYSNTKKIMTNLITNAVKYTQEGFVNFSVKCALKNNECRIFINVKDSGRGIKEEDIDKLFGKFQRLDEDKNTTTEGTGLGLAITKKLITMMNGTVKVKSTYGEGTEFICCIDQLISTKKVLENKDMSDEVIDLSDKNILIVDDNEINIKVARKIIGKYKCNIESVNSGKECLNKVNEFKYDLILLDDMMPNMNGKDTLKKLKEDTTFTTPTVMLTANAIDGMKADYIALGFSDYLSKPIERKELNRVLNKFLNTTKSVLIVDDNKINLKVARKMLESFDYKIEECTSGKECLDLVNQKQYDIIFMDIMMPEMDGVETFNNLRMMGFEKPIIALTADSACDAKERYLSLGFNEYISKPSNKQVFKEILDKLEKK